MPAAHAVVSPGWRAVDLISDLHLHSGDQVTFECWRRYLLAPQPEAEAVFILGDLFEVWWGDDVLDSTGAGEAAGDSANIDKLLLALKDVPDDKRSARFHCVLVYLRHAEDPTPLVCHGIWQGRITQAPAGNAGFGYDPVFFVPSEGCTSAELSRERKAQLSHRGKALAQLVSQLEARG